MTEQSSAETGRNEPAPDADATGRYLYCVVDTGESEAAAFSATGVDGADAYVVESGGVGAVVHPSGSAHEPSDVEDVKRWLLEHQSVVDEAGAAFGTPLPFRFDTVVAGDDGAVRGWIEDEFEALADALASLAGQWEYRVELVRDPDALESSLADEDDRLADLRERRRDADEGTAFMLEKQYERRLGDLVAAHVDETADRLADDLRDEAREVQAVDRTASLLDGGDGGGDDDGDDPDSHSRSFAVLAPEHAEDAIGDVLDEFAAEPGAEVRFTGPWPPYSFAPDVGEP